jgi:hypothetical protein
MDTVDTMDTLDTVETMDTLDTMDTMDTLDTMDTMDTMGTIDTISLNTPQDQVDHFFLFEFCPSVHHCPSLSITVHHSPFCPSCKS